MNVEKAIKNLNHMSIPNITEPFNIRIYWFQFHEKAPDYLLKSHRHSFFEVHFMIEGETEYDFNGKSVKISSTEALLISPNVVHSVTGYSKKYQKFAIGFAFEGENKNDITSAVNNLLSMQEYLIIRNNLEFVRLCNEALSIAENPTLLTSFRIRDIVFAIIDNVVQLKGGIGKLSPPTQYGADGRVEVAKRYILDNIRRHFTISEVSSSVYLSEKQLSRIFFEQENKSIATFIKEEKLKEAKNLLSISDEPLKNLSETLGWSSEYNFIRFFRNAEGVPPGAFRRIIRDK